MSSYVNLFVVISNLSEATAYLALAKMYFKVQERDVTMEAIVLDPKNEHDIVQNKLYIYIYNFFFYT